jgi:hypothetical protein
MMAGAPPAGANGRLRVGLAVSSARPQAWVGALARAIAAESRVELAVFVYDGSGRGWPRRPAGAVAGALWRAFRSADALLQRVLCAASPRLDHLADLADSGFAVAGEAPGGLSVVVNAAGPGAVPALVAATGAPVWWLDHDGGAPWPDVASGYAETLGGAEATTCRLLAVSPGGVSPEVLAQARFSTHPLVASENRQQLLWKSIALVTRTLRQESPAALAAQDGPALPAALPGGAGGLALLLACHALRAARFVGTRLTYREQWCLALVEAEGEAEAAAPWRVLAGRGSRRLLVEPPPDRYWADPHVLQGSGGRLILVEEYPYATRRGRIALLRLDAAGHVVESRTVLELDCHLSYPSLLEVGGALYMLPESSEGETLTAYRCVEYPWRWEPAATLLEGVRAVDATIVHHDGRWWLFATVPEEAWLTPRDTLHVFFADDPLGGEWTPHPLNPVVCDTVGARPAGPLLSRGGRLYRPGQDCGRRYGYGVRVHEVLTLTTSAYEEREVAFVAPPGGGLVATHTLAEADGTIVVDVLRWLRGRRG